MENKPILTSSVSGSIASSSNLGIICSWINAIKKRHILTIYSFFGFFFAYIFRANLSVAILEMSKQNKPVANLTQQENNTLDLPQSEWSPLLQGYILSSFFYGYILTQIPAAYLTSRYGGRNLFGAGVGLSALLCLAMPLAAYIGPSYLMAIRILQGLCQGFIYPAMHCLWSKWCPPNERSRLATFALSGSYIGSVTALSSGGLITIYLNWQSIFYIFGVLGLIWSVFWFLNVYESPSEHQHISCEEKNRIESTLNFTDYSCIPWSKILRSAPVWAIVIAHFAENWGFYTMLTEMPTFLSDVLNFQIDEAGVLSALPYLIMAKVLYFSGCVSDKLVDQKLDYTQVRKIFCCAGFVLQALFMFAMTLTINRTLLIIFLTLSIGFGGMPWSAFGVNHLDIGAGYANVLMSITNTFATLAGIISPTLTGHLIEDKTKAEWNDVFNISAMIFLIGAIFYYFLGTGEVQHWAIGTKEFENPTSSNYNDFSRNSTFSVSEVNNDQENSKVNK
ncbi:Vesicular glutamate transporter 1 [Brachionus plicatilis]|uniref:Sialin n=1 Tax=Brachionus plicatilis TaxID=10195 RepID=A0A3M7SMM7_BRAPC|nr:Vesicular glutamate transporter 1 [Brachionus plicatilis]